MESMFQNALFSMFWVWCNAIICGGINFQVSVQFHSIYPAKMPDKAFSRQ